MLLVTVVDNLRTYKTKITKNWPISPNPQLTVTFRGSVFICCFDTICTSRSKNEPVSNNLSSRRITRKLQQQNSTTEISRKSKNKTFLNNTKTTKIKQLVSCSFASQLNSTIPIQMISMTTKSCFFFVGSIAERDHTSLTHTLTLCLYLFLSLSLLISLLPTYK